MYGYHDQVTPGLQSKSRGIKKTRAPARVGIGIEIEMRRFDSNHMTFDLGFSLVLKGEGRGGSAGAPDLHDYRPLGEIRNSSSVSIFSNSRESRDTRSGSTVRSIML